jgi:hypothetical protein
MIDFLKKFSQTYFFILSLVCLPTVSAQHLSSANNANDQNKRVADIPVFGDICLGDTHKVVSEKLRESNLLELAVNEVYLGRFGLNGSYRTKKTIGGLKCLLYFDWDHNSRLKELTMQTQPQGISEYESSLKRNWKELIDLMTALNGKPLQAADYPHASELHNNMSLNTHLWRLNGGGTAMLGISKSAEGFMICIRFVSETIKPVIINK